MSRRFANIVNHRPFYGWLLVLITATNGSFAVGGYLVNSVLLVPMQQDLGWSRTTLLGVLTLKGLAAGALGPIIGPLGDHRWAPRLLVPVGTVLLGVSFLAVKWIDAPLPFYLVHGLVGAIGMAFAGPAVLDAVVVKWFRRKRPQALMWTNTGPATGPLLFPPIVTALVLAVGWRDAWFWMGIVTIGVLLPLSLLIRTRPEDKGVGLDGEPMGEGNQLSPSAALLDDEASLTRREAMRTWTFWLLAAAMALALFGVQGYQVHWIPYLRESGFSAGTAAGAMFVYGVFTVSARFFWGYWSARFATRNLLFMQGIAAALFVVLFINVGDRPVVLFGWAVLQGLTLAGVFQLQALLVTSYYGRRHFGAIRGTMLPAATLASASSPLLLGLIRDVTGTYTAAFGLVAGTWMLAGLLILFTRNPQQQLSAQGMEATDPKPG